MKKIIAALLVVSTMLLNEVGLSTYAEDNQTTEIKIGILY